MDLNIAAARALAANAMRAVGHTQGDANIIADHLMDCELRGLPFGGVARALSVAERIRRTAEPPRPVTVVQDTAATASIDGGDQVGYLVASRATDLAIEKARTAGLAAVGAHNTYYTGMFAYYLERVAKAGLVGMAAGSAPQMVAPHGGSEPRFGTNPIAFGFPSAGTPVIWDVGTSAVMHSDVMLRSRLGQLLPEGAAFDAAGLPTRDPTAALAGAFAVWGGHKGSGLALMVHLLGMMCGGAANPAGLRDSGFFLFVIDPRLMHPAADFEQAVSDYVETIRSSRAVDADQPLRIPFERSVAERQARIAQGTISIPDAIHDALARLAADALHAA